MHQLKKVEFLSQKSTQFYKTKTSLSLQYLHKKRNSTPLGILRCFCCFCLLDHCFFVMEYLSELDLWHQRKKMEFFSQKKTQLCTLEIIVAPDYLHWNVVIHR